MCYIATAFQRNVRSGHVVANIDEEGIVVSGVRISILLILTPSALLKTWLC